MLNLEYNGVWFFDHNKMILEQAGWWGDYGKGDSVGRNAFAYIVYPNERWLKDTLIQCIKQRDDTYIQFYRYPDEGADTMSRDHVGAILLALYINKDWEELDFILENIPWRLSRKYSQTIDFWLWMQWIRSKRKGKKSEKFLANIFYFLNILLFCVTIPWNWLIRRILRVKAIAVEEVHDANLKLKWWERKLSKLIYPTYALFLLVWQIRIMPETPLKETLKDLLLLEVEKENIVLRGLLGKEIKEEDYKDFRSINVFRWSIRYDRTCNVSPRLIPKESVVYNNINQEMLDYVYYGFDKICIDMSDEIFERIKGNEQIIFY